MQNLKHNEIFAEAVRITTDIWESPGRTELSIEDSKDVINALLLSQAMQHSNEINRISQEMLSCFPDRTLSGYKNVLRNIGRRHKNPADQVVYSLYALKSSFDKSEENLTDESSMTGILNIFPVMDMALQNHLQTMS